MSHPLYPLQRAARQSPESVESWLRSNLPRLRQRDLLRSVNGDSSAPSGHAQQYQAFAAARMALGEERLYGVIREILASLLTISIHQAETALIFSAWLRGSDFAQRITPLFPASAAGSILIDHLPPDLQQKLGNDSTYKRYLADGDAVVAALVFFACPPEKILRTQGPFAYGPGMKWLKAYLLQLQEGMVKSDLTRPFARRWQEYLAGREWGALRRYFSLPSDQEELSGAILASGDSQKMIAAIPAGKVAWRRFKKELAKGRESS